VSYSSKHKNAFDDRYSIKLKNSQMDEVCDQIEIKRGKSLNKDYFNSIYKSSTTMAKDTYTNILRIPVTKDKSVKNMSVYDLYTTKTFISSINCTTKMIKRGNIGLETE
jgi:hypothetical protein